MSGFEQNETERRLANIVQIGTVIEVDYSNPPKARVQIGDHLTGWLRMGSSRAGDAVESWPYSAGEEVVILSPSGDLAQGIITCALANGVNPADAADQTYKATFPGGVVIEVKGSEVHIAGDVIVTGNVKASEDVKAGQISLKTHTHSGVMGGPSSTGGPQ